MQKGTAKSQWEIMQGLGIPDEEIPNFADPEYWVKYFPPLAKVGLVHATLRADSSSKTSLRRAPRLTGADRSSRLTSIPTMTVRL